MASHSPFNQHGRLLKRKEKEENAEALSLVTLTPYSLFLSSAHRLLNFKQLESSKEKP